ncbi:MAG: hypothetical protein M0Q13_15575 [Methanothrix sp.]|jgi:hypothetical protein|nr:hypothetical protein [Methanothrix sp.]
MMVHSNLTLIFEIPQQASSTSLLAAVSFFSALLGALATGLLKYGMDRKSKMLQSYGQLIGKKFSIVQTYKNLLYYTCDVYYNEALKKEAEKLAELNPKETDNYQNQMERVDEVNQENKGLYDRELRDLTKEIENFWRIIGKIQGLLNDTRNLDKLIDDIGISQKSLDDFQSGLIADTREGLPDKYITATKQLKSSWRDKKKIEIDENIKNFELKIDDLIVFVNEKKNKPWWNYLK